MTFLKYLSFFLFIIIQENRLTFHANCKETICKECQSLFSSENKEIRIESIFVNNYENITNYENIHENKN